MRVTATKRFTFAAAHRLPQHDGLCRFIHGHEYVCEVTIGGTMDEVTGMVVDFGLVKNVCKGWVDAHWDHAFIYQKGDGASEAALDAFEQVTGERRAFAMSQPPTAEAMAKKLVNVFQSDLEPLGVQVEGVTLWETESSRAVATPERAGE